MTASGSTISATHETNEVVMPDKSSTASIWYYFVAPSTGSVVVTTIGSSFDTILGVYGFPGASTSTSAITDISLVSIPSFAHTLTHTLAFLLDCMMIPG
jgi:hypothetical protein